ncbi:hypothetical protein MASR2M79_23560 [Aminivibrio sp.]
MLPANSPSYHQAISRWFTRRHGWTPEIEWIRHAPGVVPALAAAILAFTQPGDGVLVQPPVYYPFFTAIRGRGRTVVENPLLFKDGRFEMDYGDLEKKLEDSSVKLVFLCSYNPWGASGPGRSSRPSPPYAPPKGLLSSPTKFTATSSSTARNTSYASIPEEARDHSITTVAPSKTFNIAGLSTAARRSSRRNGEER